MGLYAALGCTPTWTCAPYLLANRPASVAYRVGRIQRHRVRQQCSGRAHAALRRLRRHRRGDRGPRPVRRPAHRRGTARRRYSSTSPALPADAVMARDAFFPLLGHLVGQWCGSRVPSVAASRRPPKTSSKPSARRPPRPVPSRCSISSASRPRRPMLTRCSGAGPPSRPSRLRTARPAPRMDRAQHPQERTAGGRMHRHAPLLDCGVSPL